MTKIVYVEFSTVILYRLRSLTISNYVFHTPIVYVSEILRPCGKKTKKLVIFTLRRVYRNI
jgi:hypothetical protein